MRASRGEIKIEEILQQAGMNFTEEYSFPDLISSSGRPLRFDFAVFNDDGSLDFLIDEASAKAKLMSTKVGQNMTIDQRNEFLKPFIMTGILREQMLNLVEDNQGVNIILKQSSRSIKKDKFSAFIYGLYYVKKDDERRKKKKKFKMSDMMFFS